MINKKLRRIIGGDYCKITNVEADGGKESQLSKGYN